MAASPLAAAALPPMASAFLDQAQWPNWVPLLAGQLLWQAGHLSPVGENDKKKKKGILCPGLFGKIGIDLTSPVSGPEC